VAVTVDDSTDVLSVMLAAQWKQSVDPRNLGSAVTSAMNAATMQALAKQVERPTAEEPPTPPVPPQDGSRITLDEPTRLPVNTIETEQTAITRKIHDLDSDWAMPDTGAMRDASAADGDGSDWRPGS
jgi:hypothetical protein